MSVFMVPVQKRENKTWASLKPVCVRAQTKVQARKLVSRKYPEPRFRVGEASEV